MNQLLKEIKLLDLIKYVVSAIIFFYSLFAPLDKKVELHSIQIEANKAAIEDIRQANEQNRTAIDELNKNITALSSYLKGKGIYK